MEGILGFFIKAFAEFMALGLYIAIYFETYISPILLGPIVKGLSVLSLLISFSLFFMGDETPINRLLCAVFLMFYISISVFSITHTIFLH